MTTHLPPQTPLQEQLISIWRDMLRVEPIGIDDDFFDLGGHSLLAIKMLARVDDNIGVRLHLKRLVEDPTIRGLSAALTTALETSGAPAT
jgi:aryl carrier-like protein